MTRVVRGRAVWPALAWLLAAACSGGAPDPGTPDGGLPGDAAADAAADVLPADVASGDAAPDLPGDLAGDLTGMDGAPPPPPTVFGGERPATLRVPRGYDPAVPAPLVVVLHGYSASGEVQEAFFRFSSIADDRGFLLIAPDGTIDSAGNRFWNATDACCDFEQRGIDDGGYILGLVDEIAAVYAVDPKRVYLVGHSNGGFLAHRIACDAGERIAAIASLAGAQYLDPARCKAATPVAVLQIHGDEDEVIAYDGGQLPTGVSYPGAVATVAIWADKNGCDPERMVSKTRLDIVSVIAGAETEVSAHTGCAAGGAAELWTIEGGSHIPLVRQPEFPEAVWSFFAAHPRP